MSYEDLTKNTTPIALIFKKAGVPTQDPDTLEMVYGEGITINTTGLFIDLSPSEIVARQQIQDDSRFKLVLKDTVEHRTITSVYTVTIDGVIYEINGKPKHPQLSNAWITVYIKEK